ncbi:hypothetical protein SAMN05444008_11298 [Cnuella takakiae]|uniref:Uncharacterized protein n=1 Tax=Cnuella takakiae TaxID=1302690 RepID=A0A1M5ELV8_9BACT|nr:hypothetical protein BUE76_04390 [Cnuella takakiae]SHF80187.1 hypothetical protein SAMN05444008_11298 [Cnuella takakiae]
MCFHNAPCKKNTGNSKEPWLRNTTSALYVKQTIAVIDGVLLLKNKVQKPCVVPIYNTQMAAFNFIFLFQFTKACWLQY